MSNNKELVIMDYKNLPSAIDTLIDKSDTFLQISTRAADPENKVLAQFNVFDESKLLKIAEYMPEINRASRSFGRKNTQTTNKLMTLTMLAGSSTYRILRQCLAEIESKRSAIKDSVFKLKEDRLKIKKILGKIDTINITTSDDDVFLPRPPDRHDLELESAELELQKLSCGVADSMLYLEGALKELASFQSVYKQICKNKNIPEDWNEKNFEAAEIRHHVRMAFLHTYRDMVSSGSINMGTMEYLHQFGINPVAAHKLTTEHIAETQAMITNSNSETIVLPTIEFLEKWLDEMEDAFADAYKSVLDRMGIDELYEDWYMYTGDK